MDREIWSQKPGFLQHLGENAKIIAETRFLGFGLCARGVRNRVSSPNFGEDA